MCIRDRDNPEDNAPLPLSKERFNAYKIGTSASRHSIISVSYTHLDVYKRQVPKSPFSPQCGLRPATPIFGFSMPIALQASFAILIPSRTVSYTHLDVYKRQG